MIFETLQESAVRRELLLVDGGLAHFHLRRDGQLTLREILVLPDRQGQGIGTALLETLKAIPGVISIFARCPSNLPANDWYLRKGFVCEGSEVTRTGRKLTLWRLPLV